MDSNKLRHVRLIPQIYTITFEICTIYIIHTTAYDHTIDLYFYRSKFEFEDESKALRELTLGGYCTRICLNRIRI